MIREMHAAPSNVGLAPAQIHMVCIWKPYGNFAQFFRAPKINMSVALTCFYCACGLWWRARGEVSLAKGRNRVLL
jgi:hypothetical protein